MKKNKLNPRKKATQSRSQVTVNSIIQATTQILKEIGPEKLTTNKIVERAGVSIGSLYQYFPNKHSILSAVVEKQFNKTVDKIIGAIEALDLSTLSIEQAIDEVIGVMMQDHFSQKNFIQKLAFSILTLESMRFTLKNDERIITAIKDKLAPFEREVDLTDIEDKLFFLQYVNKGIRFGTIFTDRSIDSSKMGEYMSIVTKSLLVRKSESVE